MKYDTNFTQTRNTNQSDVCWAWFPATIKINKLRSITNIENAIDTLETQFEKCEEIKAEVGKHKNAPSGSDGERTFFVYNFRVRGIDFLFNATFRNYSAI